MQRETLVEERINPDERMAIFLYRMGRGNYIHTVAELFGVGDSTICNIVLEVSKLMLEVIWDIAVHSPATDRYYINLINDFEKLWQFPYCFGAIEGCQIPVKCQPGSREFAKEYRNFKNCYSIVLMAIGALSANHREQHYTQYRKY